jgi:arylsulfatase A-like enzyme
MVMYDTLNRAMLSPYGCDWTKTPNFARLAEKTVTFDNCYAGSLPCMPARRELHTGRFNFLHRSWGPLEPFDDSMPELLKSGGVYTHLVSDHQHYWEDGGATYHTRYNSWDCVRGQEGDPWKAVLPIRQPKETAFGREPFGGAMKHFDAVNREHMDTEDKMPQARTFAGGLEFLETNCRQNNWFLQIETFDPHEPFFSPEEYKALYPHEYTGPAADWPPYKPVAEDADTISQTRFDYAALLSMCDAYLGKVLDFMDALDMWSDTMLIVNTDHGFLLGEHDWWGKAIQPIYNEIAHIPLFVWDPRLDAKGERRAQLVQTVDLAPTLLDFFGKPIPESMEGKPLRQVIKAGAAIREYAAFGYHAAQVNITDGAWLYMRGPVRFDGGPVYDYTLMPTRMRRMFSPAELRNAELHPGFGFTKNCPVLKVPAGAEQAGTFQFGNKLFNLDTDPGQLCPVTDDAQEMRLIEAIRRFMLSNEAPDEQYDRLGISKETEHTAEDLLKERAERAAQLEPGILAGYELDESLRCQLLTCKIIPFMGQKCVEAFEAWVLEHHGGEKIGTEHLLEFIKAYVNGDMLDLVMYILPMAGRVS